MSAPLPDDSAPTWVTIAFLAALSGGVVVVVGEVLNRPVLALVGLAAFIAGIIGMSIAVVVASRKAGRSVWSATWDGIKAAGRLLRELTP